MEWCKVLAMITDTEGEWVFNITMNTINYTTGELMKLIRLCPIKLTSANFGTNSSDETEEVRRLEAEKGKLSPAYEHYLKKITDEPQSNKEFAEWVNMMVFLPLLAGPY